MQNEREKERKKQNLGFVSSPTSKRMSWAEWRRNERREKPPGFFIFSAFLRENLLFLLPSHSRHHLAPHLQDGRLSLLPLRRQCRIHRGQVRRPQRRRQGPHRRGCCSEVVDGAAVGRRCCRCCCCCRRLPPLIAWCVPRALSFVFAASLFSRYGDK